MTIYRIHWMEKFNSNESAIFWHGLDETQQLAAFLQPDQGICGAFQVANNSTAVKDDGSSALDENHCLLQPIAAINIALRISQDGEWQM